MIDGIYVDSGGSATLGDFFSDTSYSGGPGGNDNSGIGCALFATIVLLVIIWMCV